MLCYHLGTPCDVQDDSTRRFHHNTTFVCNIAIGGVCLILILGILAVHAWRVLRVCRQRKVWSVHLQAAPCLGSPSANCMPDLAAQLLCTQSLLFANMPICDITSQRTCTCTCVCSVHAYCWPPCTAPLLRVKSLTKPVNAPR